MQTGWTMQNSLSDPDCVGSVSQCKVRSNIGLDFFINNEKFGVTQAEGNPYLGAMLLPSHSFAHEMIHTMGASSHSNLLWCGNSTMPVGDKFRARPDFGLIDHAGGAGGEMGVRRPTRSVGICACVSTWSGFGCCIYLVWFWLLYLPGLGLARLSRRPW
jgi:hypothetical protein